MGGFKKWIKRAFHSVGEFISHPIQSVGHAVGSVFHEGAAIISDVETQILSPVVSGGTQVIQTTGSSLTDIFGTLSGNLVLPLSIGAGVFGIYLLTR